MAKVGTLSISFTSDMAKVIKDFDRTSRSARRASKDISKSLDFAKKAIIAFISYSALKQGAAFINQQMQIIDANAKLADSFGITTEALAVNSLMAQEAGINISMLSSTWAKMTQKLYEASQGNILARKEISNLGLEIEDLISLSPDKQFEKIVTAISKIRNPTERLGAAMKLFGESAQTILPIINNFPATFASAAEFTDKFGLSLSRIDSAKVERANDAFGRIGMAIGGIAGKIGVELSPVIEGLSTAFIDGIDGADKWALGTAKAIDGVVFYIDAATVHIRGALSVFEQTTVAMGGLGAAIVAMAKGDRALAYRITNETTDMLSVIDNQTDDWMKNHKKLADYLKEWREKAESGAGGTAGLSLAKPGGGVDDPVLGIATTFAQGWEDGLEKTKVYFEDYSTITEKLVVDSFKGMEDALVSFVETGKTDFRSLADSIISDLLRLQIRQSITQPLFDMLGGGTGGGILGSIGSGLSSVFGGARAAGGSVDAGKSYLVGEKGKELFTPASSGSITPNHALSSAGGDTYYIDARGADQGAIARLENMIRTLNGTIEPRAVRAVSDAQMRGVI